MSAIKIPPVTEDEVRRALLDPSFTVYIYVGDEKDAGWEVADFAFGYLSRLRLYLAANAAAVKPWLDPSVPGGARPRGIVFGYDDKVDRYLNKAETEDLMTVLDAISNAQ